MWDLTSYNTRTVAELRRLDSLVLSVKHDVTCTYCKEAHFPATPGSGPRNDSEGAPVIALGGFETLFEYSERCTQMPDYYPGVSGRNLSAERRQRQSRESGDKLPRNGRSRSKHKNASRARKDQRAFKVQCPITTKI